jgi:type 1 glutamine amidotransferase
LFVSVRRHPLPKDELDLVRAHVAAGKPVVGIRTASHAFHVRNQPASGGLADWRDFDPVVFGGNYTGHHGNKLQATIWVLPEAKEHPIVQGISLAEFPVGGSLYQTSPLKPGAVELVRGKIETEAKHEPVAWTFKREDGGMSFYTSLGHPEDFARPEFRKLVKNALAHLLAEGSKSSAAVNAAGTGSR